MNDIRKLQNAILVVAKEIHRICEENEIKYFMLGGTFIGAVRHKGFIPWDDDIDLGMTFDNYQKFIAVAKKLNHSWLVFDFPEYENDRYRCLFTKAYDSRTTLKEATSSDAKGVFVDIFPVIPCANDKKKCRKVIKSSFIMRKILERKYSNIYRHRPCLGAISKIVAMVVSRRMIYRGFKKEYANLDKKRNSKYYVALDGTQKDVYDARYFKDDYVLYPFEDTMLYGIKDYHHYLTDVFHDYMKLPPLEMRVPHHIEYVNIELPFAEYKG